MYIPYESLGKDTNKSIIFIHGNGFPPSCYNPFLSHLEKQYYIQSMYLRPLWKNFRNFETLKNWDIFLDDFINYSTENNIFHENAIGHSIGGNILLRAAIKNSDLFKSIVLLDPTIFHPLIIIIWKALNSFKFFHEAIPHVRAAKHRTEFYNSYDEIFSVYRKKEIFSKIKDVQLKEYINSIFNLKNNKYKLSYDKKWEEAIYIKACLKDFDIWNNLDRLKTPTLIITPDQNPVLSVLALKKISKNKFISIKTFNDSTHLFPLEAPKRTSKLIINFLSK